MKNWMIYAGLGVLLLVLLKKKGAAVSPVEIGRVESYTTSEANSLDILSRAIEYTKANEAPEIKRFRNDIAQRGLSIRSCETIAGQEWCTLSNSWTAPSWLLVDYFGLNKPSNN